MIKTLILAATVPQFGGLLYPDIFIVRHPFATRQYLNRLAGLPLYYAAQFMITFSTRFPG